MKPVQVVIDGSITLDATLTEKHSATVELTKHPVESGVSPIDHARELPEKVVVEGVFTNTPVTLRRESAGTTGSPGSSGHAQDSLNALRALKSARRAVTVTGPWRSYSNMVLVQLEYSRDSKLGDAVKISATFEEVRFVSTQTVLLKNQTKPVAQSVKPKTTGKTEQGKQPTTPVNTSWAKGLTNSAGGTKVGSGQSNYAAQLPGRLLSR
jgi:hypothetical protein